MLTVTAGACTVTTAVSLLVLSATLTAVMLCVPRAVPAVYNPPVVMVPEVVLPSRELSTYQLTPVLLAFSTVALNC